MNNKEMQTKRVMGEFINASNKLIRENGIENISLRKVSKIAGYNSATMYNYFENLDHLIFFGAMKYLNNYTRSLNNYLKKEECSMDRFLKVWEYFCFYAYSEPQIYNAIFFPNLNNNIGHYMKKYYDFFPEELLSSNTTIRNMLLKDNINDRAMTILSDCVNENYIKCEDALILNDMTLVIFEGIFKRVLNKNMSYKYAIKNTMLYFKLIIENFLIKDYNFYF